MARVIPVRKVTVDKLSTVEIDAIEWAIRHAAEGHEAAVAIDRIVLLVTGKPIDDHPDGTKIDLRKVKLHRSDWDRLANALIATGGNQASLQWMNRGPGAWS